MKSPYIFAHRGGMGICKENTISCFKTAIDLGVGIETDVQLTKDKTLICFHDYIIKQTSKIHDIANLTYKELLKLDFSDERKIPTLIDLLSIILKYPKTRLSVDIRNFEAGKYLIDLVRDHNLLSRVEITDKRLSLLARLRRYEEHVNLVYTIPDNILKINEKNVNFSKLKQLNVKVINLRSHRANFHNFEKVINHDLECYVWALNYKSRIKRILQLKEKDKRVSAIYTDYPNMVLNILNQSAEV